MAEPTTSSAAAGFAGWKLIGGAAGAAGIGAALVTLVVMSISLPRSRREWNVGLTSTVVSSLAGGAYALLKLGLAASVVNSANDVELLLGLASMGGIFFAAGLPGWALVRWAFAWIAKRDGKDLAEVARDAKADVLDVLK